MKKLFCLILAFTFCFLTACGESENSATENSKTSSSQDISQSSSDDSTPKYKNLMANITPSAVTASEDLSKGNQAFASFSAKLFKECLSKDGKNTLISPLSTIYALGMTSNGAQSTTKSQMEEVFGITTHELNEYLYSYAKKKAQDDAAKLSIANSIWFDEGRISVKDTFLQKNADYYGAGANVADFSDSQTVKDINNWVKEKTEGMIDSIIEKISADTVMYLINALAFEAEWVDKYTKESIFDGEFTLENSETIQTEYMRTEAANYIKGENAEGFFKAYKGDYAFIALLPKEGMSVEDLVNSLTGEEISKILASRKDYINTTTITALPKFETEYELSMKEAFKNLGMSAAFDGSTADFSEMGVCDGLHIGDIIHKTFIKVDESGTKAGAVTAVVMDTESAPDEIKVINLNRPFVYMLVDTSENVPFFMGTMMDPRS